MYLCQPTSLNLCLLLVPIRTQQFLIILNSDTLSDFLVDGSNRSLNYL